MDKYDKLLFQILRGTSDANVPFNDLRNLLKSLGFEERIRGAITCFVEPGSSKRSIYSAKAARRKFYQVRQVRAVILKYKLGGEL